MQDTMFIDPLSREIILQERTWFHHIVRGHPELTTCRDLVEDAVRSPEEIRVSSSDPNCRLYYGTGPRESVIMMVVVDLESTGL